MIDDALFNIFIKIIRSGIKVLDLDHLGWLGRGLLLGFGHQGYLNGLGLGHGLQLLYGGYIGIDVGSV